ncbi:hypothetical protein A6A22_10785 [Arthrobacter sp. OY3WO11]|nr:hypothetical protein A6A22_10785 [Arthrobacter sp. OY3WO11]BFE45992.1 hypothetical protein GCM10017547_38850 [Pseudarthrobacter oxydans]
MREYHWSAWFPTAEGGLLIVRGGVHESERDSAGAVEEIKSLVAAKFPAANRDEIVVSLD